MSVRMRHTKGHTGNRRSHHALKALSVLKDKESGKLVLPHRLDESTGMYRGMQIVAKKEKKQKEVKEKHEHKHEHAHPEKGALPEGEAKSEGKKGVLGKLAKTTRPRSRSGMGGGATKGS